MALLGSGVRAACAWQVKHLCLSPKHPFRVSFSLKHLLSVVFGKISVYLLINAVEQCGTGHPWEDKRVLPRAHMCVLYVKMMQEHKTSAADPLLCAVVCWAGSLHGR